VGLKAIHNPEIKNVIVPGMIQVCLCVDSTRESSGFEVFEAALARRRSEACLLCGCSGIVEIADAVEGRRDMEGRDVRKLITATRSHSYDCFGPVAVFLDVERIVGNFGCCVRNSRVFFDLKFSGEKEAESGQG
jgi:hypothetical protein